jgi:uncharacterized protein YoxC
MLKGAVYGIYSDSACKNKVDTMTTDANGHAKSSALTAGTYKIANDVEFEVAEIQPVSMKDFASSSTVRLRGHTRRQRKNSRSRQQRRKTDWKSRRADS